MFVCLFFLLFTINIVISIIYLLFSFIILVVVSLLIIVKIRKMLNIVMLAYNFFKLNNVRKKVLSKKDGFSSYISSKSDGVAF